MQIKDVMSHPPVTCPATSTLDHAARLMWEFDCGIVPVVDDDGRLAGVVTDRDICMAAYAQGQSLPAIKVATAMSKAVIATHPDDRVDEAEHLMRDNQIRRLPVLDADNRPVGLLSMTDLAHLAERAKRIGLDRELVETLAAVSQPRGHATSSPRWMAMTRPAAAG